ncbi:DegV family protein [Arenimonas sp.]|uniref:DegV family protein n=1 Tax=Arenimonas sp. TaxID=1872635 RepID=UPI0039E37112
MSAVPIAVPPLRIRGPALRRALISGVRRVIAQRETLNRINVFPVPDGDTGSNLAFTLSGLLTGALSRRTASAGELLHRVGEDAVDSARGNSGAILAQFFTGLAEAAGRHGAIDPAALAQAIRAGAASARQALAEPKEGTILSVIHAFAEALDARHGVSELRPWFQSALARARQALANTPNQLPVLQKAGVVDAGAQGFVDLLEGIDEFMRGGRPTDDRQAEEDSGDLEAAQAHGELFEGDPEHRWCSECLLIGEGLDRAGLRAAVSDLGASCVVVAGSHSRLRLHAHVSDPKALFETAARFGRVEATKADDMHAQARSAAAGGGVAVVTDSAADLPDEAARRLNIHMIPVRVGFGDQDYLDKVGLTTAEFYRKLRTELVLPRTSQPPPGDFRRQFEFLLSHHPSLVYVGLARAVSGTLQSAETAAQRGHPERTRIFDSANGAGGQALLAITAAEWAQRGESVDAILAELERLKPLTLTWAVARDIGHAVRGGRIPRWAKPVVSALGLTPIARFGADGKLKMAGAFLGGKRIPERFARYVAQRVDRSQRWRLLIGHCDAYDDGVALQRALQNELDCSESWVVETGPAVGAHAGPGALVAGLQPAPK